MKNKNKVRLEQITELGTKVLNNTSRSGLSQTDFIEHALQEIGKVLRDENLSS